MTFKKITTGLLVLAAFTTIVSCGTDKSEKTLSPKSTEIKGDLGQYFEVVQKDYPLENKDGQLKINVEIKRKETDFAFDADKTAPFGTNPTENYHAGFGIELFTNDAPKGIKNAIDTGKAGVYKTSDIVGLLKLKKGDTGYIRWAIDDTTGLKTFQLTSALEGSAAPVPTEGSNTTPAGKSVEEDWNIVLNQYDALVTKYISLAKKAKNNDIGALAEIPLVVGQINALTSKMQNAKGKMTPEQWSRFITIQTRFTKASVELGSK